MTTSLHDAWRVRWRFGFIGRVAIPTLLAFLPFLTRLDWDGGRLGDVANFADRNALVHDVVRNVCTRDAHSAVDAGCGGKGAVALYDAFHASECLEGVDVLCVVLRSSCSDVKGVKVYWTVLTRSSYSTKFAICTY